eukprot:7266203-Ditylum_brightwellii.AAC.1
MESEGWFERGHDITGGSTMSNGLGNPHMAQGVYVWEPAPVAVAVTIEELCKGRHKRQAFTHI